jgi:hypothetical protein
LKALRGIGLRIEEPSRKAQPLARIVDTEPPNSIQWKLAATELVATAKESSERKPHDVKEYRTLGFVISGD